MESPFDRPPAVEVIAEAIKQHADLVNQEGWCGPSLEMFIYSMLVEKSFLKDPEPPTQAVFWAVAKNNWGDEKVKRIETTSDDDAIQTARDWRKEDLGIGWSLVVTKQIYA